MAAEITLCRTSEPPGHSPIPLRALWNGFNWKQMCNVVGRSRRLLNVSSWYDDFERGKYHD